jgi:hypothetical protein
VTMRLNVRIDDLRGFLRNPVRPAAIPGTVHVAGMTARPVPVDHGSLHLLAAADGGPRRTMDYALPFTGDTRQRWWLRGAKHVQRQGQRGPWGTTKLDFGSRSAISWSSWVRTPPWEQRRTHACAFSTRWLTSSAVHDDAEMSTRTSAAAAVAALALHQPSARVTSRFRIDRSGDGAVPWSACGSHGSAPCWS